MGETSAKATRPRTRRGPAKPITIALEANLGYAATGRLHATLKGAGEAEVVIEAGAVERVSTAAVMALVSFVRARGERKPPAIVVSPSDAFVDAFSDLGLFADLMRMEFRT